MIPSPFRAAPQAHPDEFLPALIQLQDRAPHPLGRRVILALGLLLAALLLWALIGRLDIVAVANGKLVPASYVKIVQPAEAGIVKEILVKEGEPVAAGQVLMRMDALIMEADATALAAELARKRLSLRRIDAELAGHELTAASDDPPALAREVRAQLAANRAALDSTLAEERARLARAQGELAAAKAVARRLEDSLPHYRAQDQAFDKLVKDGYAGPLMGSDKRRERMEKEQELETQRHVIAGAEAGIAQSEKRLAQIEADARRQLHAERAEAQSAAERLAQEVAKQSHRRTLLELKAPQAGIVKDLATHTAGTVVQPGTVMLTLVPQEETLRAEVWVSNEDVGFVRPGQQVKLKFAAFPFQKYGMAEGTVAHVGADATEQGQGGPGVPGDPAKPAPLAYRALVSLERAQLSAEGVEHHLSAGMQTSAEILLGTRSVAEYLLSPVKGAWHEAGRER